MARVRFAREWHGMELSARVHRASARAILKIGETVAANTKRVTHVQFGTLRRSVHVAPAGYDGANDERMARSGDLQTGMTWIDRGQAGANPVVEVGSWLPYACAEWIGRGHPGVTQGLEMVRGAEADAIVFGAFKSEGL